MRQLMVPGSEMARQVLFAAWEEGTRDETTEWIDQLWKMLDRQDDFYRKYQVPWQPATVGHWEMTKSHIPQRSYERIFHVCNGVNVSLDRDPGWGDVTVLKRIEEDGSKTVWMSDTRAEIMEHSPFINKLFWVGTLQPRILINGLGLGMAVHAALEHGASHVDVVEIDKTVIDIIAPNFEGKPVTIHHADALTYSWPKGTRWSLAWHDIWPTIAADNVPEMDRLHRRYQRKVQWQASWQRKGCLALKKNSEEFKDALDRGDWAAVKRLDPDF